MSNSTRKRQPRKRNGDLPKKPYKDFPLGPHASVNCGFGNHDCAMLPLSALNLKAGWVDYPRPKTGISRRCKLWPETVQAVQAAIDECPDARREAAEGLVFVTANGKPWLRGGAADPVGRATRELLETVGVYRRGLGFYTLRHVHRTIADGARDPVAANLIMGHSDSSMAANYTQRIEDARLVAVTDHIRVWLFPETKTEEGGKQ